MPQRTERAPVWLHPSERHGAHAKPSRPPRQGVGVSTSVLIFVVENDESIQLVLADALTDGGYALRFASSAEDAISILDEGGTDFQALITDVNLAPGKLTGWDVARHAREIREDIPVIYMTGGSAHEWSANGVPKSVLLTKPFAMAQIVIAVSQLIDKQVSGD